MTRVVDSEQLGSGDLGQRIPDRIVNACIERSRKIGLVANIGVKRLAHLVARNVDAIVE